MAFVPARCTQCNGNIVVDDSKDAGICESCGTAFVTEKAVNNYLSHTTNNFEGATIHVTTRENNIKDTLERSKKILSKDISEVDINSQINILSYELVADEENDLYVRLTLKNYGPGAVESLKIKVTGKNQFNDLIPVQGNESFFLTLQDIYIGVGKTIRSKYIPMPDNEMRKLELSVSQIRLSNDKIISNDPHIIKPSYKRITNGKLYDFADLKSVNFKNFPIETPGYWLCICETANNLNMSQCRNCYREKDIILSNYSESYLQSKFDEHCQRAEEAKLISQEKEAKERIQQELKQKESEQNRLLAAKKRQQIIPKLCIGIILILLVFIYIYKG